MYNFILKLVSNLKLVDKSIMVVVLILLITGIMFSISASSFVAVRIGAFPERFILYHILYVGFAMLLIILIATTNYRIFYNGLLLVSLITFLMLLYLPFFSVEIKGAKRWVYILGFSIQPSEILKVIMPIWFSTIYFNYQEANKGRLYTYLVLFIFYVFAICLLLTQPDLGMAILISSVFFIMLFVTNINFVIVLLLSLFGIICSVFAYFIFPHVNKRINSFLFSDTTPYQSQRALDSLGSGGVFGKGAGLGEFKRYLPDAHTDFIFAVIVEELGLIFGLFLISLYFYMFSRMYKFYLKNSDNFFGLTVLGLGLTFILQVVINISSNINLIPTKGMTLPLISYGGSSMLGTSLLIGIVLLLMREKSPRVAE